MSNYCSAIRVFIADQQEVVRAGLKRMVAEMEDVEVAGEAGDGAKAIAAIVALQPDVVIIDEHLPPGGAIEVVKEIKRQAAAVRILVWTSAAAVSGARQALGAGALGFCDKGVTRQELELVLRSVASGAAWLHRSVSMQLLDQISASTIANLKTAQGPGSPLSAREMDVLALLAAGMTNFQIAKELCLSAETVKTHVQHIIQKLAVRDRTQAAIKAVRERLIEAEEPGQKLLSVVVSPPPLDSNTLNPPQ